MSHIKWWWYANGWKVRRKPYIVKDAHTTFPWSKSLNSAVATATSSPWRREGGGEAEKDCRKSRPMEDNDSNDGRRGGDEEKRDTGRRFWNRESQIGGVTAGISKEDFLSKVAIDFSSPPASFLPGLCFPILEGISASKGHFFSSAFWRALSGVLRCVGVRWSCDVCAFEEIIEWSDGALFFLLCTLSANVTSPDILPIPASRSNWRNVGFKQYESEIWPSDLSADLGKKSDGIGGEREGGSDLHEVGVESGGDREEEEEEKKGGEGEGEEREREEKKEEGAVDGSGFTRSGRDAS